MDNWDEIRTAFNVARIGTVSGAAEVLGVHHATVIRHIDALEARLGVKLFQRHARGYTPTEAGDDLLRVAQATDDQFAQLASRLKGQGDDVSGELVVTSISALSHLFVPVLAAFQRQYPDLVVRYLTGERLFRLEYGEAHVAIRAGSVPDQPDMAAPKARPSTLSTGSWAWTTPTAARLLPDGCVTRCLTRPSCFAAAIWGRCAGQLSKEPESVSSRRTWQKNWAGWFRSMRRAPSGPRPCGWSRIWTCTARPRCRPF